MGIVYVQRSKSSELRVNELTARIADQLIKYVL